MSDPRRRLNELQQRVDDLAQRLARTMRHALERKQAQRDTQIAKLDALSPLAVLAKGYAICRNAATLRPVKRAADANVGDALLVRMFDGELRCEVRERLGVQPEFSSL